MGFVQRKPDRTTWWSSPLILVLFRRWIAEGQSSIVDLPHDLALTPSNLRVVATAQRSCGEFFPGSDLPSNVRYIFRKALLTPPSKVFTGQQIAFHHVGDALRSRAGQTAQDRSHGLRAGPILCDDKLKNGSRPRAFPSYKGGRQTFLTSSDQAARERKACQFAAFMWARGRHYMSHPLLSCYTLSCEFPKRKETSVIQVRSKIGQYAPFHVRSRKTTAKPKDNTGWASFLGEFGILALSFKVCNHIPHCLMRFRGRCQYVRVGYRVFRCPRAESDRGDL